MLWPTGRPEAVWRLEACRLVKRLGLRQHLLDPCCFLIYAQDFAELSGLDTEAKNLFAGQWFGRDDMFFFHGKKGHHNL